MRILWFSNSPSLAGKYVSRNGILGRSWIEALEEKLTFNEKINLGIAFSWNINKSKSFKIENSPTTYYMVPRFPINKLEKYFRRVTFQPPESLVTLPYFLKVIEDFQPDIVQFFGTESTFGLILPELKVPSVIWLQGNLRVTHSMWDRGIDIRKTIHNERWKDRINGSTFYNNYYIGAKLVEREKIVFQHANNFMGRTNWDKRLVNIMAPQANYYHCEEALRPEFHNFQWKPHKNRTKIIIISTISPVLYKGLETAFETCKILEDYLIGKNTIEWRIIGIRQEDTYVRIARKKAKATTGDGKLVFLGLQSAEGLVKELLNANMYVHPSHIENSPNSVCEAMLLGLPIIATNVGGTPSILKSEEEGILVQDGDSYGMAGAILDLIRDPEMAFKMGQNARIRGLKRNNTENICDRVIEIYNKIVDI